MAIELEGLARTEQAYDPATAILRTRLFDGTGQGMEIVDFAPRFHQHDRTFRPAQLVRRVRPLSGHPRLRFIVRPRGEWGSAAPSITHGSNHLRYVFPGGALRLTTNAPVTYLVDGTWFSLPVRSACCSGPTRHCPAESRRRRATSRSRLRFTGATGHVGWPCRSNGRTR